MEEKLNKDKPYYYLMILNAHGGLMYHKNFLGKTIATDVFMQTASIIYTIDALMSTILPEAVSANDKKTELDQFNKTRIETMNTDTFTMHIFHALTGIKMILFCNVSNTDGKSILKNVYEIYTDYVFKHPFYTMDQPVYSGYDNFEKEIKKLFLE